MEDLATQNNPQPTDEQIETIQAYRKNLYINPTEDPLEEQFVDEEAFYATVDHFNDNLLEVTSDRKQQSLQKALKTFNKIQGMKLSTPEDKLNLVRNESTLTKGELIAMDNAEQIRLTDADKQYLKQKGVDPSKVTNADGSLMIGSKTAQELDDIR